MARWIGPVSKEITPPNKKRKKNRKNNLRTLLLHQHKILIFILFYSKKCCVCNETKNNDYLMINERFIKDLHIIGRRGLSSSSSSSVEIVSLALFLFFFSRGSIHCISKSLFQTTKKIVCCITNRTRHITQRR